MDNGSDHAVILGDKVTVTLGGKQFVFSEPVIRKARMMHADAVALTSPVILRLPERFRKELQETGRIDSLNDLEGAAKSGEISLDTLLALQRDATRITEGRIKFLEDFVPGLADAKAGDTATDAEVIAAFTAVMQLANRVYQPAKKNEMNAGTNPMSTTKADSTN